VPDASRAVGQEAGLALRKVTAFEGDVIVQWKVIGGLPVALAERVTIWPIGTGVGWARADATRGTGSRTVMVLILCEHDRERVSFSRFRRSVM
jgi:hypothetical protein